MGHGSATISLFVLFADRRGGANHYPCLCCWKVVACSELDMAYPSKHRDIGPMLAYNMLVCNIAPTLEQCICVSVLIGNIAPTFINDMFICNIAPTLKQFIGISLLIRNIAPILTNDMFICNIVPTLQQCVAISLFNFNIGPTFTNDMFICNIAPTLQQCVGISLFNFNIGTMCLRTSVDFQHCANIEK